MSHICINIFYTFNKQIVFKLIFSDSISKRAENTDCHPILYTYSEFKYSANFKTLHE